ncbi:hypothetical protein KDK_19500 [Dictyobacter kobayashii]|uniref:Glycosyltransferase RgtA/B/C/D-like domain-containing protein n=1 Tax=Dictyobacter kobayashii TaxID=2014872 RepID=A0A402AG97_9CHLR|nr:hypothetical protein KDK_19500 [Dictyobacter kobayashii]
MVDVDGTRLDAGHIGEPRFLLLANANPVVHEYQMDGTDSTNNLTLDQAYFENLATSPYYLFQSWMRDLDGTSAWRDLQIVKSQQVTNTTSRPVPNTPIALPATTALEVHLQLQRPETPRTLSVIMADQSSVHITVNRNDRYIQITRTPRDFGATTVAAHAFFPQDPLPFAAMVVSFLARTLLWSLAILGVVLLGDVLNTFLWHSLLRRCWEAIRRRKKDEAGPRRVVQSAWIISMVGRGWKALTAQIHPIALFCLAASFCFVLWIAKVQYHGLPHIYDANAYFFAAKIYAHGQLATPLPPMPQLFPGPFVLQFAGKWFAQYPPGTALTLVPGMWLGLPWVIEPLCGTLMLLGCGLILAHFYNRQVATLAIILGTLSPFYSYLAASYLSHAIALFYLVWGWWALLRFMQDRARWYLYLSIICFGLGALTRDLVGILWIGLVVSGCIVLKWSQIRLRWRFWLKPILIASGLALCFVALSLGYNLFLTHNALLSPRSLFYAPDKWGFGSGIGFYGQHTLASGLVNLDELLTSLAIDLYGWPFYLTLAFVALPFITGRARLVDWILLLCLVIMTGAYVGYFYHGIYLGPRYLFETLPFLLGLTARGIIILGTVGVQTSTRIYSYLRKANMRQRLSVPEPWSLTTGLLLAGLLACNLVYYLPRQTVIYQNYTGLPSYYKLDLNAIYHPQLHNAIVVTGDYNFYEVVLFPLNDPDLHSNVVYAFASDPALYAQLHKAFPGRKIYQLNVSNNGTVQYQSVDD